MKSLLFFYQFYCLPIELRGQVIIGKVVDSTSKDILEYVSIGIVKTANVLFSVKKKQGCLFSKWGVEAKWRKNDTQSPSIYLTIQE